MSNTTQTPAPPTASEALIEVSIEHGQRIAAHSLAARFTAYADSPASDPTERAGLYAAADLATAFLTVIPIPTPADFTDTVES